MDYSKLLSTAKLVLAVQSPTLEDCWSEGYYKSKSDSLDDNPYVVGTANHHHWEEGWWAGFYANISTSKINEEEFFLKPASNDSTINEKNKSEEQSSLHKKQFPNKIVLE